MAKDVHAIHSEVPTDRLHVVDVVIDAARQLRAVRQVIGLTAIPRIVEDDGSIACKAREILDPRGGPLGTNSMARPVPTLS